MRTFKASFMSFILPLVMGPLALLIYFSPNFLFSPLDRGPLDYRARLEATAESPDKELTVKVFRQRNPTYSAFVGAEMYVKVYDRDGGLLYDKLIGSDGAWSELNGAFQKIEFDGDFIRLSQLWGSSLLINRRTWSSHYPPVHGLIVHQTAAEE